MALILDVGDADGERITVVVAEAAIVLRVGKLLRSLKVEEGIESASTKSMLQDKQQVENLLQRPDVILLEVLCDEGRCHVGRSGGD